MSQKTTFGLNKTNKKMVTKRNFKDSLLNEMVTQKVYKDNEENEMVFYLDGEDKLFLKATTKGNKNDSYITLDKKDVLDIIKSLNKLVPEMVED